MAAYHSAPSDDGGLPFSHRRHGAGKLSYFTGRRALLGGVIFASTLFIAVHYTVGDIPSSFVPHRPARPLDLLPAALDLAPNPAPAPPPTTLDRPPLPVPWAHELPHPAPEPTPPTNSPTAPTAPGSKTYLPEEIPIVELAPKKLRKLRPALTDPWADLPSSWGGHDWLQPSRFPGVVDGVEQGMRDPPDLPNPPMSHLQAAFNYAAASAGERKGMRHDPLTGRPLLVPRAELFDGTTTGWTPPSVNVTAGEGRQTMPMIQVEPLDESPTALQIQAARRAYVKRAFLHVWQGYKDHAWGHDELSPLSDSYSDRYNGWGATIFDNLDTLLIMDLSHEYNLARQHVEAVDFSYLVPRFPDAFSTTLPPLADLSPPLTAAGWKAGPPTFRGQPGTTSQHSPTVISTFETIIRYLGGMLSAYDLSSDPLMLARATELGDWLLPALGTTSGLAIGRHTMGLNRPGAQSGMSTLSEVGSLTLEFTRLSMLTGDETYFLAAQRATDALDSFPSSSARLGTLLPTHVDPSHPSMLSGEYTFGALADSYYEYLVKQAQLIGNALPQYARMYTAAIDSAWDSKLLREIEVVPDHPDFLILGSSTHGQWNAKLQHLTCFAGGMLALGARLFSRTKDFVGGEGLTATCAWAYESSVAGVGPESSTFYNPTDASRYRIVKAPEASTIETGEIRVAAGSPTGVYHMEPRHVGRPETIESVWYMYRTTGDRKWQDQGWRMFTSWMEHSITASGFASIMNVQNPSYKSDMMESFVLAETLKYYYLLFSPHSLLDLDSWVFNTEAHPFYIPKPNTSPTAPSPTPLWTGPDLNLPQSFVPTLGEGSDVQKWARIQQAAALAQIKSAAEIRVLLGEETVVPARVPKFIRPSEEEMRKATAAAAAGE